MSNVGLLALTRKAGEVIEIVTPQGDRIEVVLIETKCKDTARIGVRARKDFKINRKEFLSPKDGASKSGVKEIEEPLAVS